VGRRCATVRTCCCLYGACLLACRGSRVSVMAPHIRLVADVADAAAAPGLNPYDIRDEDLMKGGKRSRAFPNSGNRSSTWRQ